MLILMAIAVIATALVGFVIYANTDVEKTSDREITE